MMKRRAGQKIILHLGHAGKMCLTIGYAQIVAPRKRNLTWWKSKYSIKIKCLRHYKKVSTSRNQSSQPPIAPAQACENDRALLTIGSANLRNNDR